MIRLVCAVMFSIHKIGLFGSFLIAGVPFIVTMPRSLGLVVFLTAMILFVYSYSKTTQGNQCFNLLTETQRELKKVVWPTQQETLQSLVLVGVSVFCASLFFWMIDSFITNALSMLIRFVS